LGSDNVTHVPAVWEKTLSEKMVAADGGEYYMSLYMRSDEQISYRNEQQG